MHVFRLFKTVFLTLLFTCFYAPGTAQSSAGKPFTTGEIPQLYKFEKLTAREAKIDTKKFRRWKESLASMENGSAGKHRLHFSTDIVETRHALSPDYLHLPTLFSL